MPSVRATGATHTLRYGCRQEERNIDDQLRKRWFIQFESHTRLLALIITLSVGYLGP